MVKGKVEVGVKGEVEARSPLPIGSSSSLSDNGLPSMQHFVDEEEAEEQQEEQKEKNWTRRQGVS